MVKNTNSNVPQIRFKGFEGEWKEKTLGELCEPLSYGLNAAAMKFDGTNKYLRITDIDDESRVFRQSDLTSPKKNLSTSENYVLKIGDVVLARTGASVGKTYLYKEEDGHVFFAGFLIRARTTVNVDEEFVFQNTLTLQYGAFVKLTSQRSGQPGINAQEYSAYSLHCPAPEEQTQIGEYFREMDLLIELRQRKHDKLVMLKKAMLQKMFPLPGTTTPEVRFKGFKGEWIEQKLGELCDEFHSGKFISASEIAETGDYPIYGGNGLRGFTAKFNHDGLYTLIGRQGALCGNMNLVFGKSFFTEHAIAVQANKNNDTIFLYYLFGKMNLGQYSSQSAQPGLAVNKLQELCSSICMKSEQIQIGTYFRTLDELISKHAIQLQKLKQLKSACLEKMYV